MDAFRIAVAGGLLSSAVAASAFAAPLAPSRSSQIVTAYAQAGSPACPGVSGYLQVATTGNPNGTSSAFTIPAKSVFIVTSFDYEFGATPSQQVRTILFAVDPANPPTALQGAIAIGGGLAGPNGGVFVGTTQISPGLVIKPPAVLCAEMPSGGAVVVHGFFAKDN